MYTSNWNSKSDIQILTNRKTYVLDVKLRNLGKICVGI
jgi:hypothetical protein